MGREERVPGVGPPLNPMGLIVLYPVKLQNTTLLVVLWTNKHFTSYVFFLYLENQSSTREKIAQLQHIQFLVEQQPIHRRELITKLSRHLVR